MHFMKPQYNYIINYKPISVKSESLLTRECRLMRTLRTDWRLPITHLPILEFHEVPTIVHSSSINTVCLYLLFSERFGSR